MYEHLRTPEERREQAVENNMAFLNGLDFKVYGGKGVSSYSGRSEVYFRGKGVRRAGTRKRGGRGRGPSAMA